MLYHLKHFEPKDGSCAHAVVAEANEWLREQASRICSAHFLRGGTGDRFEITIAVELVEEDSRESGIPC